MPEIIETVKRIITLDKKGRVRYYRNMRIVTLSEYPGYLFLVEHEKVFFNYLQRARGWQQSVIETHHFVLNYDSDCTSLLVWED